MRNLYLLASLFAAVFAAASITVVGPASAQLSDILLGPKTPFDRGIEARSSSNIARDNAIVIDANKIMAELGTAGVADVNFRVTGDPFGNLYLLGRARSGEELKKEIAKLEEGDGVKNV